MSTGNYLYAEASFVRPGAEYDLVSPKVHKDKRGWCFRLNYNMYGQDMGELDILIRKEGTAADKRINRISGDQGKGWKEMALDIKSNKDLRVGTTIIFRQFIVQCGNTLILYSMADRHPSAINVHVSSFFCV